MKQVYRIALFLLIFGQMSCQKFTRNFDSIKRECGSDVDPDKLYIKIVAPHSGTYRGDELQVLDSKLDVLNWELSPQACLSLPSSALNQTLIVRHKERPEGLFLKVDQDIRRGLTYRTAEKQEIPRLDPPCEDLIFKGPKFASFRNSSLNFGVPYRVQEDILTRDLQLLSTRVEGGLNQLTMLTASGNSLSPGNYVYRLTLQHPFQKASAAQVFQCPFIYDDVKPDIQASPALVQQLRKPLPPFKELNWNVQDTHPTVLEVCQQKAGEARHTFIDNPLENPTSWTCSEQDYQKQVFRTGAEPGRWNFCVRATDLAMNTSEPICGQYLVSLESLTIATSWQVPQLPLADAAILPARLLDLPARIEVLHPDYETTGLLNRLQCRVRLKTENGTTYSGRFVSCSSGRCRGQTMEDFVPCDQNIHLGLEGLWSRSWSNSLQLTLDTRLEGIGAADEMRSHSLWLNQASLRYEDPASRLQGGVIPQGSVRDFMRVGAEQYLLLTENQDMFFLDRIWKKVSLPSAVPTDSKIFFLSEKGSRPLVLFKSPGQGSMSYAIEQGEFKPLQYEPAALGACLDTPTLQGGFLLCAANDAILKIGLQTQVRYPWPAQDLCQRNSSVAESVRYRLTQEGKILLLCSGQLLQLDADSGKLITRFQPQSPIAASQWVEDGQGRVWLTWDEFGGYYEKSEWHDVAFPHEEDNAESLVVDHKGQVIWRGLHWDFGSKTWNPVQELIEMPWDTRLMSQLHSERLYAVSIQDFNQRTLYFEGPFGWERLPATEPNGEAPYAIWGFTGHGDPIIGGNASADRLQVLIRRPLATLTLEASRRLLPTMSLGLDAQGRPLAFGFDGEAYLWGEGWTRQADLSVFASENYDPNQFVMNSLGVFFQIGTMGLSTFQPQRGWSHLLKKEVWPAYVGLQLDERGRAWFYETELSQDRVVVADAQTARRFNPMPDSPATLIRGISPDFKPGETLVLYSSKSDTGRATAGLCSLNPDTARCESVVLSSLPAGAQLLSLHALGHGSFALYYERAGQRFLHVVNPKSDKTRDLELPFDEVQFLKVGTDQKGRLIVAGSWRTNDDSDFVEQLLLEQKGSWETLLERKSSSPIGQGLSFSPESFVIDGRNQLWIVSSERQDYLIRMDLNGL
jgi:hypothetical protein